MRQTVVVNGVSGARGPEGPQGPQGQASSRLVRRYDFTNPDDFWILSPDFQVPTLSAWGSTFGPNGAASYLGGATAGVGTGEVSARDYLYLSINADDVPTELDTLDPPIAAGDTITLALTYKVESVTENGTPPAAWPNIPGFFDADQYASGNVTSVYLGPDSSSGSFACPPMVLAQYAEYASSLAWSQYWHTVSCQMVVTDELLAVADGAPIIGTTDPIYFYVNYFPENGIDISFAFLDVFVDRAPA